MKEFQGQLNATGMRFGIVVARFNELITKNLLDGALHALKRHGANDDQIAVAWVPGSFEIPLIAQQLAFSGKFDAVICLGAVVRGQTAHFDYVAGQSASGIARVSQDSGIPVMFGVLTTDTLEQALERAGSKAGNKGHEAAVGAIEMVDLIRQVHGSTVKELSSCCKSHHEHHFHETVHN